MISELPIAELRPNAANPRLDVGEVAELAESIRAHGLLQPLVVVEHAGHYVVIAGNRRLAACIEVGLEQVPVTIRKATKAQQAEIALAENLHRRDLTPVEEALAYAALMKDRGLNQTQLSKLIGRDVATVSKRLALLRLPKDVVRQVHEGQITANTALGLDLQARRGAEPARPKRGRPPTTGLTVNHGSKCLVENHRRCGTACEVRQLLDQLDGDAT